MPAAQMNGSGQYDSVTFQQAIEPVVTTGTEQEKKDARIAKVKELAGVTFGINAEDFTQQDFDSIPGSNDGGTKKIETELAISGMTIALANYDGTTNTAQIEYGKPVCLDLTTMNCVTGIRPEWTPAEYIVVGTSWCGKNTEGKETIPITLGTVEKGRAICRAKVFDDTIDESTDWKGEVELWIDGAFSGDDKITIVLHNCQPLFKNEEILVGFNLDEGGEWQVIRVMEEEHYCIAQADVDKGDDGVCIWDGPDGTEEIEIDYTSHLGNIVAEDIVIIRWMKMPGFGWAWFAVETECEEA